MSPRKKITLLIFCLMFFFARTLWLIMEYTVYRSEVEIRLVEKAPSFPAVTVCTFPANDQLRRRNGELNSLDFFPSWRYNLSLFEFVRSCEFNGRDCEMGSDFRPVFDGLYGRCFTFNHDKSKIRTSIRSGPIHGLRLLLNTTESGGARIVVHEQGGPPVAENYGMNAQAGSQTALGVKTKIIRRLGNPFAHCRKDKLWDGSDYSQDGCYLECRHHYIRSSCGCDDPRYPQEEQYRCDPTNEEEWRCVNHEVKNEKNILLEDNCNCAPACTESVYATSYSTTHLPPTISVCSEHNSTECMQLSSSATALIEVFQERNSFEEVVEKAAYPMSQLLSDIIRNIVFAFLIVLFLNLLFPTKTRNQSGGEGGERIALNKT